VLYIPAYADVYNAVNNFPTSIITTSSTTQSVNGVWSYGYATLLNPVNFSPDTSATADYFGDGSAAGFYTTIAPYPYNLLPTVLENISGGTLNNEGGTIGPWPTNLLLLHPGCSGNITSDGICQSGGYYSVVRFTAPASATYVVTGEFLAIGNYSGVTADSASITTSGPISTTVFSTTSTSTPQTFNLDETLMAGESLDFAVGLVPSGQFYYDSTGFNVTIAATPEPGFYGAVALGLCGLTVVLRRRPRS
jgi:hypothetical protein